MMLLHPSSEGDGREDMSACTACDETEGAHEAYISLQALIRRPTFAHMNSNELPP